VNSDLGRSWTSEVFDPVAFPLSNLEILDIVETAFNDTTESVVLNVNEIQETYINLLKEHDLPVSNNHNYKPHLKQLILQNIAYVHFSQPPNRTKPELVVCTKIKNEAISSTITSDNLKNDLKVLLQAAKILRKDIASSPTWKFNGTFADYKPPPCSASSVSTQSREQGKLEIAAGRILLTWVHRCLHNTLSVLTNRMNQKARMEHSNNDLKLHSVLA